MKTALNLTAYSTPPLTLAAQIALDQLLLVGVGRGELPEHVRLAGCSDEGIVLGISQQPDTTVNADQARREGLTVLKRFSGGGTVMVGRGCLLYSVVVRTGKQLAPGAPRRAYEYVFNPLRAAFAERGLSVSFQPPCDLAVLDRKIAGNAQAQKRGAVLIHGCLLINEDLERISRCLRHPPDEPAYRRKRPHSEFLCNLSELGFERAAVEEILSAAWAGATEPRELAAELIAAARGQLT